MISRYLSRFVFLQVREETAPLADDLQQTPAGVVVLGMALEVLGELLHALGEKRHLHLRAPRILLVRSERLDDFFLGLFCQWHSLAPFKLRVRI